MAGRQKKLPSKPPDRSKTQRRREVLASLKLPAQEILPVSADVAREPKEPVKRILREEVRFGCPIPGCRSPFLMWHHFNPTWRERHHNDPEGMIAICTEHHPMADAGAWSKDELESFKRSARNLEPVTARFPWMRPKRLVRIGGNYAGGARIPFLIEGECPVLIEESPENGLELSFSLRDETGQPLAEMRKNTFAADPQQTKDLRVSIGATRIKFDCKNGGVFLDLWFDRLTHAELLEMLRKDFERAGNFHRRHYKNMGPAETLPSPELQFGEDRITKSILSWVKEKCMDDEGRVPVLDFRNMVNYHQGKKVKFRHGIRYGAQGLFYSWVHDSQGVGIKIV